MKLIPVVVCIGMLSGCATSGVNVDPSRVAAFEKGKTTRAEIENALGRPNVIKTSSDGKIILTYQHVDVRVRGETFIPFIGGFVGGSDVRTNEVSISLDHDGRFESVESTTSEQGHSLGGSSEYRPH